MTNLLNYFDRVRPKKSNKGLAEWEAMCPAHEGSSGERKLVITELDTEYKLYCRSHGCSSDDILAAVGLSWKDRKKGSWVSTPRPQFDTYHQALIMIAEADMAKGKVLCDSDKALYKDAKRREFEANHAAAGAAR